MTTRPFLNQVNKCSISSSSRAKTRLSSGSTLKAASPSTKSWRLPASKAPSQQSSFWISISGVSLGARTPITSSGCSLATTSPSLTTARRATQATPHATRWSAWSLVGRAWEEVRAERRGRRKTEWRRAGTWRRRCSVRSRDSWRRGNCRTCCSKREETKCKRSSRPSQSTTPSSLENI